MKKWKRDANKKHDINRRCSECNYLTPRYNGGLLTESYYFETRGENSFELFICQTCYRNWTKYASKWIFEHELKETIRRYAVIKRERDIFLEKLHRKEVKPVVMIE